MLNWAVVRSKPLLWIAGLVTLLANTVILIAPAPWPVTLAALALGLLPGTLLVAALFARPEDAVRGLRDGMERGVYALGAGYVLLVLTMLALSALPGPQTTVGMLAAFDALIVVLGGWCAVRWARQAGEGTPVAQHEPEDAGAHRSWVLVGLAVLLVTGGVLRLLNLGYADFQGDEARAMLRAAEVIQGYPGALLIHKKGPVEILLPTLVYAAQMQIDEAQARLPFALASLGGLVAVWVLGWRMFGVVAGWLAAMLAAVDGYLIGFARIVQYQSIVFCMTVLTVLALYRLVQTRRIDGRYLLLAALFLATGLLAHYEALWAVIPGGYLLWGLARTADAGQPQGAAPTGWGDDDGRLEGAAPAGRWDGARALMRAAALPAVALVVILALFYVPFVLDVRFGRTYEDIVGNRIGSGFPYNNLADFLARTVIYSSSYYLFFLITVTVLALIGLYFRNLPRWAAWTVSVLLVGGLALTFANDRWLQLFGRDQMWLFFAAALLVPLVGRRVSVAERTAWLWFGVPMILAIFFVSKPNSHVYGFFAPWALIVGATLGQGWRWLAARVGVNRARLVALPVALGGLLLFAVYEFWLFDYTQEEVLRNWARLRPAGYWTPYAEPDSHSLFGFPARDGWKAVGALYAQGVLDAPFDADASDFVSEWYDRGRGYCPRDHELYIVSEPLLPSGAAEQDELRAELAAQGYGEYGQIYVNDQPKLTLYQQGGGPDTPHIFKAEEYTAEFDRTLSTPFYAKNGPVTNPAIQQPVAYRLGEAIWLQGFDLEPAEVAPGETLLLNLYWKSTAPIPRAYKVFTQVIDLQTLQKAGQLDGDPGCAEYPTDEWRVGDTILDRYRIPIAPEAAPGAYTLLVGLYDPETEERLPVFAADGTALGDAIQLATVRVQGP